MPEIRQLGAQVVGISADSQWSHKAFAKREEIDFPLLADWFGNAGRLFGVWSEEKQREMRTVYVIDAAGVISYKQSYPDKQLPDIEPAMEVLRELSEREEKLAG